MRIAITRRIFPELVAELRTRLEVIDNQDDRALDPEGLRQRLHDADGALLTAGDRVDDALLQACPRLRAVCNIAVGHDNLDLDACTRHGVLATNTPEVLNEATADHAWALLLAAARRVGEGERYVRAGRWRRWTFELLLGAPVHGATLGIVGMGRIGRAIARRAQGFAMPVLYANRNRLAAGLESGARWVSRDELLAQADHVVIAVPHSPQTHHLIGAAELARMKPTAVLVNVARGGVVDDGALVAALHAGTIAAAGLDVFEGEPALHPGFLALDNVVLTPHVASSTRATRTAMARLAIDNLEQALAGRRPPALLNPAAWPRRRGTDGEA